MLVCVDSSPLILQTTPPEFHHLYQEDYLCFPSQLYCHSQHILLDQPLALNSAVANVNTTLLSQVFISRFPQGSEVSSLPCPRPWQCETDNPAYLHLWSTAPPQLSTTPLAHELSISPTWKPLMGSIQEPLSPMFLYIPASSSLLPQPSLLQ